jgi:hypothetical protein
VHAYLQLHMSGILNTPAPTRKTSQSIVERD